MTRGVREDVWGDNIMNGSDFYDRDNFIGNHLTELYTRATGVHPYSVSIDIVNEEGYYIEVESSTILFTGGPPRSLPDVTEGDGLNRRVQINITGAAMDAERSKVQIPPYSTATLTLFNYTGHIESFLDKPLRVGLASEYREKLVSNILLFEIDGISTALDGSDYEIYSSDGMIDGVPSSVFYRSTITISKRNDVSHRDIYSLRGSFSSMPASIIYGSDIFVVHKDRQLSDSQSYKMQLSDYDTDFNTVANGSVVKIKKYGAGEVFATDQVETNSVNACVNGGVYLRVGTDGKWAVTANAGVDASNYISAKTVADGSHTLYKIAVVE